jgi:hypothetical protein
MAKDHVPLAVECLLNMKHGISWHVALDFFLNAPKIPADLIIRRVESLQQAPAVQHKLTPWLKAEA